MNEWYAKYDQSFDEQAFSFGDSCEDRGAILEICLKTQNRIATFIFHIQALLKPVFKLFQYFEVT